MSKGGFRIRREAGSDLNLLSSKISDLNLRWFTVKAAKQLNIRKLYSDAKARSKRRRDKLAERTIRFGRHKRTWMTLDMTMKVVIFEKILRSKIGLKLLRSF